MGSIDLQDAYLLVPIHPAHKRYSRFKFQDQFFQFEALLVFTKLMKLVISSHKRRGLVSIVYLDNFWCSGNTFSSCQANIRATIITLESLGSLINYRKSMLTPSTQCKYLGITINSVSYTLELPEKKKAQLKQMIAQFKHLKTHSILNLAKLTGLLIFACQGVKYGLLYTKVLERTKTDALINSDNDFLSKVKIPTSVFTDLDWWSNNLRNPKKIKFSNFLVTVLQTLPTRAGEPLAMVKKYTGSGTWTRSTGLSTIKSSWQ